ncbi:MAG TPA: DUF6491 family protein [Rhodanobacteraceae bacterium]|nr:DUF6491 family protein [Rhodanobacteraceae bacterium]
MSKKGWVVSGLLACLVPMAASAASQADRLARFQRFAGPPVERMHYYNLIGFENLGDNTVAVWTGVNRAWLIRVKEPCPRFNFANALGLTQSMAHVFSKRFDAVDVGDIRCMVKSIRPVDMKAMHRAGRAAQSASGAT